MSFISKTFGGLSASYLVRQYIFGIILGGFFIYLDISRGVNIPYILFAVVSTILYPYSRFVYESIIDFIFGNNIIVFTGFLLLIMLFIKLIIIIFCWSFSIVIAPIGLLFLYFYHTRKESNQKNSEE
ncbi:MAG: hypothetical protein LBF71_01230 [Campylobacteraceae bacterium]|jgi:hypothetical protein|nr:hypothetical protein [Campylobacteraceae bacterium]